jgi:hypothetical protein
VYKSSHLRDKLDNVPGDAIFVGYSRVSKAWKALHTNGVAAVTGLGKSISLLFVRRNVPDGQITPLIAISRKVVLQVYALTPALHTGCCVLSGEFD